MIENIRREQSLNVHCIARNDLLSSTFYSVIHVYGTLLPRASDSVRSRVCDLFKTSMKRQLSKLVIIFLLRSFQPRLGVIAINLRLWFESRVAVI